MMQILIDFEDKAKTKKEINRYSQGRISVLTDLKRQSMAEKSQNSFH